MIPSRPGRREARAGLWSLWWGRCKARAGLRSLRWGRGEACAGLRGLRWGRREARAGLPAGRGGLREIALRPGLRGRPRLAYGRPGRRVGRDRRVRRSRRRALFRRGRRRGLRRGGGVQPLILVHGLGAGAELAVAQLTAAEFAVSHEKASLSFKVSSCFHGAGPRGRRNSPPKVNREKIIPYPPARVNRWELRGALFKSARFVYNGLEPLGNLTVFRGARRMMQL